ncbi:PfkB family carbohydrate kinase [Levilactobacillus bambusae]|uniref:pyridoxal kinase n=1 Tax=Levilactobacillus bambusae TaxID=2024736 RepID=A0A2V1MYT7_9LACO|nr:PfkB family carbohydrate kinase [Levilactobacillus bambusae]PWG00127.1 hypothetical protein DCM90_04110 [Levilactobacillus bambusae]
MEDLSAVGGISMAAALPILTAFGHQTYPVPTQLLSTQTEGFGVPAKVATTPWLDQTIQQWQTITDFRINTALIGYVGELAAIDQVEQFLSRWQPKTVLIDPVLGDEGRLYPGLDAAYVDRLIGLLPMATLITPNVTELGLLTNDRLASLTDIQRAITKLEHQYHGAQVVVTGIQVADQIGCGWLVNDQLVTRLSQRVSQHLSGAGDTWAALLLGYFIQTDSLDEAISKAAATFQLAATCSTNQRSGINLVPILREITKRGIHSDK